MIHSFSNFRLFQKCQRQWFLKSKVWCANTKDAYRLKVIELSNLKSIHALRGDVVDYTIDRHIVATLNKGYAAELDDTLEFANEIFLARRAFAEQKLYKDASIKKSYNQEKYAALIELEMGKGLSEEDWDKAWTDVETSLTNLLCNDEVVELLEEADYLVAQRSLNFKYDDVSVRGVPDLILFWNNRPPLIIDWKVHFTGTRSYIDQLLLYALALNRCKPHRDFKQYLEGHSILDYELLEYQLLRNIPRQYRISQQLIDNTEEKLSDYIYKLNRAGSEMKLKDLNFEDFDTAHDGETCLICPFQKLCNNEN